MRLGGLWGTLFAYSSINHDSKSLYLYSSLRYEEFDDDEMGVGCSRRHNKGNIENG